MPRLRRQDRGQNHDFSPKPGPSRPVCGRNSERGRPCAIEAPLVQTTLTNVAENTPAADPRGEPNLDGLQEGLLHGAARAALGVRVHSPPARVAWGAGWRHSYAATVHAVRPMPSVGELRDHKIRIPRIVRCRTRSISPKPEPDAAFCHGVPPRKRHPWLSFGRS